MLRNWYRLLLKVVFVLLNKVIRFVICLMLYLMYVDLRLMIVKSVWKLVFLLDVDKVGIKFVLFCVS